MAAEDWAIEITREPKNDQNRPSQRFDNSISNLCSIFGTHEVKLAGCGPQQLTTLSGVSQKNMDGSHEQPECGAAIEHAHWRHSALLLSLAGQRAPSMISSAVVLCTSASKQYDPFAVSHHHHQAQKASQED